MTQSMHSRARSLAEVASAASVDAASRITARDCHNEADGRLVCVADSSLVEFSARDCVQAADGTYSCVADSFLEKGQAVEDEVEDEEEAIEESEA